ncbi:hypothetical protein L227DRAFT_430633 [Lentinus tigrinus ALCF2SS1-6]|uniref:Secreted protein n=1 Tax=Lentinus tigrinus ALCF2SS1-6 TaxID=1328759 RepID=A0A5C2SM86_9APHY|nr:hypothetical protein L227DRAFT_430633 [Lentinus tigrinus ALCF2SS1-6]
MNSTVLCFLVLPKVLPIGPSLATRQHRPHRTRSSYPCSRKRLRSETLKGGTRIRRERSEFVTDKVGPLSRPARSPTCDMQRCLGMPQTPC